MTAMQYVVYFRFVDDVMFYIIIDRMGQNQRRRVSFVHFARWRHPSPWGVNDSGSSDQSFQAAVISACVQPSLVEIRSVTSEIRRRK